MGILKTCDFLTLLYHTSATSLHLENLDVANVFFLKVGGKVESSFFILYTQAFQRRPVNLPKGWSAFAMCQTWYVKLPLPSRVIRAGRTQLSRRWPLTVPPAVTRAPLTFRAR